MRRREGGKQELNELTAREGGRSVFGLSVGQRSRKEGGGGLFLFLKMCFSLEEEGGGGLLVWRRSRLGEGGNPQLLLSILSLPRRWSKTGSTDGCVTDAFPPPFPPPAAAAAAAANGRQKNKLVFTVRFPSSSFG